MYLFIYFMVNHNSYFWWATDDGATYGAKPQMLSPLTIRLTLYPSSVDIPSLNPYAWPVTIDTYLTMINHSQPFMGFPSLNHNGFTTMALPESWIINHGSTAAPTAQHPDSFNIALRNCWWNLGRCEGHGIHFEQSVCTWLVNERWTTD